MYRRVSAVKASKVLLTPTTLLPVLTDSLVFIDFPQKRSFVHHPPLGQVQILRETEQTVGLNETFMTKYPSVVPFTPASVQVNRKLEHFT